MRKTLPLFICGILISLLCLVLVVQAQTQCPSTCTCMLPSEAAKMKGYSLCGGKLVICGYDKAQNPLYCYQKPAPVTTPPVQYSKTVAITTTPTPFQYSKTVAITTTPTPFQYSKPILPTTTPDEVYSRTLCPENCSCVGKEMICYTDLVAETLDVTPAPLGYGKPELTTTPDEVYSQTLITCPDNCICMAESTGLAEGRSSCTVAVWAGGCEGLACEWCGSQGNEDMYCYSGITSEAVVKSPLSRDILSPGTTSAGATLSGRESSIIAPSTVTQLPSPPGAGEAVESPGGMVIPLGFQSIIGAIGIAVLIIGLVSLEKT